MDKLCENCKWWEDHSHSTIYHDFKMCGNGKLREEWREEGEEDCLLYSYTEGGCFYPGPKFGCIHWEAKDV